MMNICTLANSRVRGFSRARSSALPRRRLSPAAAASREVDWPEIGKYLGATIAQCSIISAATFGLDAAMHTSYFPEGLALKATVWLWFAGLSLRSRAFGFLDSARPTIKDGKASGKGFSDRRRPDWCPPGIVFPIVWTSIAVLRATSALMIWEASGQHLFTLPLIAFIAHLCIGDLWNYINNSQQRLGFSLVVNLGCVWTSAAFVDALYFSVDKTAGLTLLPMNIWLTIAGALIYSIWDLNGRDELLPYKNAA